MEKNNSETFSAELSAIVIHGYTSIGIAVGIDLGLFDLLATFMEPKTSDEIATAAGMKERYVREWLGVMVTSKIISLDDTGEKFILPAHCVPYLTTNGTNNSMALYSSLMANLTKNAFEKVKACFPKDGPEEKGIVVIDVGCGMGISTCVFAKAFPKSTFYGVDLVDTNYQAAKKEAENNGLQNCNFHAYDVSKLPKEWTNKFQYAFMKSVFHDLAHPMESLNELKRVLSPQGLLTVVDNHARTGIKHNLDGNNPNMVLNYTAGLLACVPLSLVGGGMGLGPVCGIEKVTEILTAADFEILKSGVAPGTKNGGQYYHCKMFTEFTT